MTFSFAMKCHSIKPGTILVLGNVPRLLRILFPIFQYTEQNLPVKLILYICNSPMFPISDQLVVLRNSSPKYAVFEFFVASEIDDVM